MPSLHDLVLQATTQGAAGGGGGGAVVTATTDDSTKTTTDFRNRVRRRWNLAGIESSDAPSHSIGLSKRG